MNGKTFLGLRTVIYKVSAIEEAKKWYTQILGKSPYFDEPFYVGFNVGGYELGLLPVEEGNENGSNVLVYWGVDDINQSYQQLLDSNAIPVDPPENVGGEVMVASVRDPWGNLIGIIYNPEFQIAPEQNSPSDTFY